MREQLSKVEAIRISCVNKSLYDYLRAGLPLGPRGPTSIGPRVIDPSKRSRATTSPRATDYQLCPELSSEHLAPSAGGSPQGQRRVGVTHQTHLRKNFSLGARYGADFDDD